MRRVILLLGTLALAAPPLAAQEGPEQARTPDGEMTPEEVRAKGKAPGLQLGGIEVRLSAPGPQIFVQGNPPDDPRDTPPPTVIGEELCPAGRVEGQFEPAQGVWQDDPTFEDRPGKQITRVSATSWHAELPMVTGRKSLLFGIERAVGGSEPRRNEIFIKGEANGSPVPVFFRFTLEQGGARERIYESEIVGQVPIGGPCGPTPLPFHVVLAATDGIPREFTFEFRDGDYALYAELVTADGRPTGIEVRVIGQSRTTHPPSIAFRPVALGKGSLEESSRADLEAAARMIRVASALQIPDLYPIVNTPLRTDVFPLKDQSRLLVRRENGRRRPIDQVIEDLGFRFEVLAVEDLVRELQVGGLMAGFDRVVAIVTGPDHALLKRWLGSSLDAVAWAANQKVVFLDLERGVDVYTVAHEIAHTLRYLYSSQEMQTECGRDYHNQNDAIGHGHQVTSEGLPDRARRDYSPNLMGPSRGGTTTFALVEGVLIADTSPEAPSWIEQCTYWHLLWILSAGRPDPPVLLVQGFVGRIGGETRGAILPLYQLDGAEDLPAGGRGGWAIVLKDASGQMLARHSWDPVWRIPDLDIEREVVSFAFRLRRPDALARVELEGPEGQLDARTLSASAPRVSITKSTSVAAGAVRVEWSGTDADGDPLLYTVLYSKDGGETWMDLAIETEATSIIVPLDSESPTEAHRVLVRATDGGRSADAVLDLQPPTGGA